MKREVASLVRGIVLLAGGMILVMLALALIDFREAGYPLFKAAAFDAVSARHFNNLFNRNLNQLVAVVFTSVAIAVPLTANMYSLKFLDFFIKDPINAVVLIFVVFTDLNNTWWGYSIKDDFVPVFQLHLTLVLVIGCFSLIFPYLYYIFKFLHPNTLLDRLENEFEADLREAMRHPAHSSTRRGGVAEGIEHIANITIRSIDRGDRNTAIESIFSLERVTRLYWAAKPHLAPAWFTADPNAFLGFSSAAVAELTESHSWVEMKVFDQLRHIMNAAIPRMHEVVSSAAKSLRQLGLDEVPRQDVALRELVIEYFNTFIRLSLQRKDPRSVFIIFDQYRTYAEAMNLEYPELAQEIAYYFAYYGQAAREAQLSFVVEAVAHDFGTLVQRAWEAGAPNRQKLLDRFLRYDSQAKATLPGVKKAQALLASYFLLAGHAESAALIRANFVGLDPGYLRLLADDLLHIKREKYWEINERRINMDYVPDPQREKLREFLEDLLAAA